MELYDESGNPWLKITEELIDNNEKDKVNNSVKNKCHFVTWFDKSNLVKCNLCKLVFLKICFQKHFKIHHNSKTKLSKFKYPYDALEICDARSEAILKRQNSTKKKSNQSLNIEKLNSKRKLALPTNKGQQKSNSKCRKKDVEKTEVNEIPVLESEEGFDGFQECMEEVVIYNSLEDQDMFDEVGELDGNTVEIEETIFDEKTSKIKSIESNGCTIFTDEFNNSIIIDNDQEESEDFDCYESSVSNDSAYYSLPNNNTATLSNSQQDLKNKSGLLSDNLRKDCSPLQNYNLNSIENDNINITNFKSSNLNSKVSTVRHRFYVSSGHNNKDNITSQINQSGIDSCINPIKNTSYQKSSSRLTNKSMDLSIHSAPSKYTKHVDFDDGKITNYKEFVSSVIENTKKQYLLSDKKVSIDSRHKMKLKQPLIDSLSNNVSSNSSSRLLQSDRLSMKFPSCYQRPIISYTVSSANTTIPQFHSQYRQSQQRRIIPNCVPITPALTNTRTLNSLGQVVLSLSNYQHQAVFSDNPLLSSYTTNNNHNTTKHNNSASLINNNNLSTLYNVRASANSNIIDSQAMTSSNQFPVSHDLNQMSFQQRLLDRGLITHYDIVRSQRSNNHINFINTIPTSTTTSKNNNSNNNHLHQINCNNEISSSSIISKENFSKISQQQQLTTIPIQQILRNNTINSNKDICGYINPKVKSKINVTKPKIGNPENHLLSNISQANPKKCLTYNTFNSSDVASIRNLSQIIPNIKSTLPASCITNQQSLNRRSSHYYNPPTSIIQNNNYKTTINNVNIWNIPQIYQSTNGVATVTSDSNNISNRNSALDVSTIPIGQNSFEQKIPSISGHSSSKINAAVRSGINQYNNSAQSFSCKK